VATHAGALARVGARVPPRTAAARCGVAREPRALLFALSACTLRGAERVRCLFFAGTMSTPDEPASFGLNKAAEQLRSKCRYARAAEQHGRAAAAAAQELAAEDCLVVAYQRAAQAEALMYHSSAPTLTAAEVAEARETVVSVLLPQILSTLTRRKAAGTLLPGSCRAAEVSWWQVLLERGLLQEGKPAEVASATAEAAGAVLGFHAYMLAATVALDVLALVENLSREMQLSHAAFVVSALELMAQPRELPSVIVDGVKKGVLPSGAEQELARRTRKFVVDSSMSSDMGGGFEAVSIADAWWRVERSGAVARRLLLNEPSVDELSVAASLAAAAAEAAVRGVHTCALASCASKEVHVSQFKKCGACRTVAYCCREHQLEDWPAHKAACKVARKNAAVKS
jgi:hypothetical protein